MEHLEGKFVYAWHPVLYSSPGDKGNVKDNIGEEQKESI